MPRVYNRRLKNSPPGTVYVGRPTKWGNPFVVGVHGKRGECIVMCEEWLDGKRQAPDGRKPPTLEEIRNELRGKNLECWCAPARCHASLYLERANS